MLPQHPPFLRWSACTDIGRVRTNNEDSFLGLLLDANEVSYLGKFGEAFDASKNYLFALSDGMGGAMAGEFASRIAVEKITRLLPKYLIHLAKDDSWSLPKTTHSVLEVLVSLFHEIHRELLLLSASYQECHGMGTTLTLCWVRAEQVYFAHIGDSRLYHLPTTGGIIQLSEDDTHVGWLLRQGMITEYQSKHHPRRNLLQKVLGADHQFVTPQVGSVIYHSGDRFLLCSDGVTDQLFNHQLLELLSESMLESPAAHLVHRAVDRSGNDNTTAIVLEFCEGSD